MLDESIRRVKGKFWMDLCGLRLALNMDAVHHVTRLLVSESISLNEFFRNSYRCLYLYNVEVDKIWSM